MKLIIFNILFVCMLQSSVFAFGLQTFTADGTSGEFDHRASLSNGSGSCIASGSLGGGTATFQVSFDGGVTWQDLGANCTFAAGSGQGNYEIHRDCLIRVVLSGSTAPNATVIQSQ